MLLGRDEALQKIEQVLETARGGHAAVLVIQGAPGIGKTRMLEEARERADGFDVLRVSGWDAEAPMPFAGLVGLLHPVVNELGRLPRTYANSLRLAFGMTKGEPPGTFAVALATLSLIAHVASAPLLLIIDDLHWIDEASLAALLFALRRLSNEPVAALLTVRPATTATDHIGDLASLLLVELAENDARECVRRAAPEMTDADVSRIVAHVGGNPLRLMQAARDLLCDPNPTLSNAAAHEHGRSPFDRRCAAAPRGAQLAALVLLLEPGASLAVVTAALEALVEPDGLAAAVSAGLVAVEGETVALVHPLVGDSVARLCSADQRREAHLALAGLAVLRDAGADAGRGVWHETAASRHPDEMLAQAAEDLAAAAAGRGDLAAAARGLLRASELSAEPNLALARLFAAGSAGIKAGLDWAPEVLRRARDLSEDPALRGQVDTILVAYATWNGDSGTAIRIADGSEDEGDPALASFLHAAATSASYIAWNRPAFDTHANRARRLLEVLPPERRPALAVAAVIQRDGMADVPTPLTDLDTATRAFVQEPDPDLAAPMLHALYEADRWHAGEQVLDVALRRARETMALPAVTWLQFYAAVGLLRSGRLRAAAIAGEECRSLANDLHMPLALVQADVVLARVDAATGRLDDFAARFDRAHASALRHGFGASVTWLRQAEAALALSVGEARRARVLLESLDRRMCELTDGFSLLIPVLPELIESCVRVHDLRSARAYHGRLDRMAASDPLPSKVAWLSYTTLLIADDSLLETTYESAFARCHASGDALLTARCHLAYGESARRRRRRAAAAEALQAAQSAFEDMGADLWAERARSELAATGTVVRTRAPASAAASLSAQEAQVAQLAATGATTREIAERIFLSPKTVEYHLTHVYRKLGVRSKAELGHVLRESATGSFL